MKVAPVYSGSRLFSQFQLSDLRTPSKPNSQQPKVPMVVPTNPEASQHFSNCSKSHDLKQHYTNFFLGHLIFASDASTSKNSAVSQNHVQVVVDLVALDVNPIAVGGVVVVNSLLFGIKLEGISPLSTLVTATGTIVKI